MTKLKFKKLDERAVIPNYAHIGDIGLDVTAIGVEYDAEHDIYIYHTGLACEMERGYALLCMPRSSNTKTEAYLPNSPGLVDPATYRGEIQFRYKNRDKIEIPFFRAPGVLWGTPEEDEWVEKAKTEYIMSKAPYKPGERIGQFVVVKTPEIEVEETDTLSETERGTGGWGSSGR